MSYETVLEQIKSAPAECLDEISVVIGNIVEQYKKFVKIIRRKNRD
ncbi:hypothetical protein [uncultured Treponema sp.]|nr:hypothetical protein [uncultured Treponema sp.]